jgi:DNA-binding MarR family transcriptional regulator
MEQSLYKTCDVMLLMLEQLKHTLADVAGQLGLTRGQLLALYMLDRHGDRTLAMSRLAGILQCDASYVTGIVDKLVVKELITRRENKQDRRTKTLNLTPRGQRAVDVFKETLPKRFGCEKLAADERELLHALIHKLGS